MKSNSTLCKLKRKPMRGAEFEIAWRIQQNFQFCNRQRKFELDHIGTGRFQSPSRLNVCGNFLNEKKRYRNKNKPYLCLSYHFNKLQQFILVLG